MQPFVFAPCFAQVIVGDVLQGSRHHRPTSTNALRLLMIFRFSNPDFGLSPTFSAFAAIAEACEAGAARLISHNVKTSQDLVELVQIRSH